MQTVLGDKWYGTAVGEEAETILKSCVHCGFCTATCPTYRLLGDELDGPRGRIYLLKNVFEGGQFGSRTRLHLDRCLTCRACETTCPSGVRYGRLLELGRAAVESSITRPVPERLIRWSMWQFLSRPSLFRMMLTVGRWLRPLLPARLADRVPPRVVPRRWPVVRHNRRMLVLDGCVQQSLCPNINSSAARVLDKFCISLIREPAAQCCGAIPLHLSATEAARGFMRRNIDAWWPHIENGIEAIVMTASGCGVTVRDYAALLAEDPNYAAKAARVASLTRDLSEIVAAEPVGSLKSGLNNKVRDIVFHPPCTLQHGQQLRGVVERILSDCGFDVHPLKEAHLCCGSAGTYALLQKDIADSLRKQKLAALHATDAKCIVTANIGCQAHLAQGSKLPVRHWIELLDD